MPNALITGWGKCLPPTQITNEDLATFIETSDEWITTRTGIKERRFSHVDTSELATVAAQHALACAGVNASDIDFIIVATASPDTLIPNIASKVQGNLGAECGATDINGACSGFIYALGMGKAFIKSGQYKNILIIGAEKLSFYLDWTRRETAVIFGDGAGAVVLSATDADEGVIDYSLKNDASQRHLLVSKFGTQINRFNDHMLDFYIEFEGREIFKRAVNGMTLLCQQLLSSHNLSQEQIDWVVPHQANLRIITALIQKLKFPLDKTIVNIEKYGNTSAATIPIALCEALDNQQIKPHQTLLTAAFGGGLSCAAALIKWGKRTTPLKKSEAKLPPCTESILEKIQAEQQAFTQHHLKS